jgi:hypothetical protein
MAARYIDFLVTGDPAAARATAEQALLARRFRVVWHDDWTATAERGSQVANAFAGAFAQYLRVGVRLMSADPGETTVRMEQETIGILGGLIGMSRVRRNMATLRTELEAAFQAAGVLRGVSEV